MTLIGFHKLVLRLKPVLKFTAVRDGSSSRFTPSDVELPTIGPDRLFIQAYHSSFLDLVEVVMQRENLVWYRLDGSTEIKKRHQAIAQFKEPSREAKVFLLSLKAGGVGLNVSMTSAYTKQS